MHYNHLDSIEDSVVNDVVLYGTALAFTCCQHTLRFHVCNSNHICLMFDQKLLEVAITGPASKQMLAIAQLTTLKATPSSTHAQMHLIP